MNKNSDQDSYADYRSFIQIYQEDIQRYTRTARTDVLAAVCIVLFNACEVKL